MNGNRLRLSVCLAASTALSLTLYIPAAAQDADVLDDILVCQQITDEAARLACFDSAATRLSQERDNGFVGVYRQDLEAVERDAFGFDLPSVPNLSFSIFSDRGDRLDPLDPSTTPERMAANETAPETVTDVRDTVEPTPTPESNSSETMAEPSETGERRGIFARLTNRGGNRGSNETLRRTDTEPVNGVAVVERDNEGGVERIVMDIDRIREIAYGRHRFYMSNGQVWVQSGTERFRYDDDADNFAEIRRAAMGSYFLQINGTGRALRVRRVR